MSTVNTTDLFLVARSGANYQVTASDMKAFMGGAAAGSDIQSAAAAPTFRSDGTSALVEGDLWFDTTNDLLKGWNGTAWIAIGPSAAAAGADVQSAAAAPTFRADGTSALVEGDLYYNTIDDTVYAWDGSAWVSTKANAVLKDSNLTTGAALIPGGNDAARPGTPATGMLRYNNQGGTPVAVEYYDGAAWTELATGGGGTIFAWGRVLGDGSIYTGLADSYNVASIDAVGNVTFTTPAPSANYAVVGTALLSSAAPSLDSAIFLVRDDTIGGGAPPSTSGFQLQTLSTTGSNIRYKASFVVII